MVNCPLDCKEEKRKNRVKVLKTNFWIEFGVVKIAFAVFEILIMIISFSLCQINPNTEPIED